METTSEQVVRFRFTGTASEYLRIWIVNFGLSLLTLGVYSAWAKVRRLKYLYGHTILADAGFDYLANPIAILKGRAVAVLGFVAYYLASQVSEELSAVVGLILLCALPWLVIKTLRFKAKNCSYRGLKFSFRASYGNAVGPFFLAYLLVPFSLGLAYPYLVAYQKKFVFNAFRYGTTAFKLEPRVADYYKVYGKMLGFAILIVAFLTLPRFLLHTAFRTYIPKAAMIAMIPSLVVIPVTIVAAAIYLQVAVSNLVWNNLQLGSCRFASTMRYRRMLWISLSNIVAVLLSLGFLYPWALIRTTQYRLDCLALTEGCEFGRFKAGESQSVAADAEELTDFLDMDISL